MRFDLSAIPPGATDHARRARHDDARRLRAGRRPGALGALRAERLLERDRRHLEHEARRRADDGRRPRVLRRARTSASRPSRSAPRTSGASGCNADPDPAGNQAKMFPSTTDGFPRTVAEAEAGFIDRVTPSGPSDGKLSLELWTPNCSSCSVGANSSYWARYYTREAADPAVRPKLVVTFTNPPVVSERPAHRARDSTPAGAATVKLAERAAERPAPAADRPRRRRRSTRRRSTRRRQRDPGQRAAGQRAAGQRDAGQRLGFDDLAATVPALGNITLASIPLLRPGGWIAALSDAPGTPLAGAPLQNVTLARLLRAAADGQSRRRARRTRSRRSRSATSTSRTARSAACPRARSCSRT